MLNFEGEKAGKRHSKLMFTEAEKSKNKQPSPHDDLFNDGSVVKPSKNQREWKEKNKTLAALGSTTSHSTKSLKQDLSDEISKQADASENDAVRAADRERKVVSAGLKDGGRVGKWHRSGSEARIEKRTAKKTAKDIKLEQRSKRHFELYGDELPSKFRKDGKHQKRQMKRRQIRTFVDTKFGKGKVDVAIKIMRLLVGAVKKIAFTLISYIGFPLLGVVVVIALLFGMAAVHKEKREAKQKKRSEATPPRSLNERLEAAKQQVAQRAAEAPPREHTQNRGSGHDR